MYFASDNTAPIAPEIMAALQAANTPYDSSYGSDQLMDQVRNKIRTLFEAPDAAVYLVATGTAANSLALATLANPWDAIFCHPLAHIQVDECGAPEFFSGGAKLTVVDGPDAKIDPSAFAIAAAKTGNQNVHAVQRGALSITNVTERGTLYSVAEITDLCKTAHDMGIATHLDGARFANAIIALGCTPAEMTWKAGVDAVSFGGTKCGLMGVEAVIIFDPTKAWEFELRRKRAGHLFSKNRFLAAQMNAFVTDDLWRDLAGKANNAAAKLESALSTVSGFKMLHPRGANILFCGWDRAGHAAAFGAGAKYYDEPIGHPETGPADEFLTARLVCSWATTDAEIENFVAAIKSA